MSGSIRIDGEVVVWHGGEVGGELSVDSTHQVPRRVCVRDVRCRGGGLFEELSKLLAGEDVSGDGRACGKAVLEVQGAVAETANVGHLPSVLVLPGGSGQAVVYTFEQGGLDAAGSEACTKKGRQIVSVKLG
jgi:hypothetical protein